MGRLRGLPIGVAVRVLVIEDDDDVSLLYRLALEGAGHRVDRVATGREGLRRAGETKPDVIVLDGMLPDIDGLDVLRSLAKGHATASIPVVMASARVGSSDKRAALERGAAAYIVKPFDPTRLAQVLEEVRRGEVGTAAEHEKASAPVMHAPVTAEPAESERRARPPATGERAQPGLRQALDLAVEAIVSIDEDQRIVDFNKGAEATFGYLAEEVLGKPLDLLLPEGQVAAHRAHVRAFAGGRDRGRLMGAARYVSARRRDGVEFPVEASITKLDVDGHTVLTAILRDATDRHRAELELRRRAEQQAAIADLGRRALTTPDLTSLLDDAVSTIQRACSVDFVNISTWDRSHEELVMAAGAGWDPDTAGRARFGTARGTLGGVTLGTDQPVVFADLAEDTRFAPEPRLEAHGVVSGLHVVLRGPHRPIGLIGVYTRTRRAFTSAEVNVLRAIANVVASALHREQQDRSMRELLESAPDAVVVVDRDGRIVSVNAQSEILFGYPREELLALQVEELVPEVARARHADLRAAYLADPGYRPVSSRLGLSARRKDGTEVPVDIMLRPMDTEDGPLVVAAVRDVTERRRQEALRDAFLHAVSHELRTPLTAVVGFSALVADRYGSELSAEGRDLVARIRANGVKLEQLLGDMLDLDRLGRGVLVAQRREVAVRDAVRHCVDAVDLGGRPLQVIVDPPELHAKVDPAQLERILENLLVNAVRHTPPGSHIELRVERSANGILLTVADDGPGVPPEVRARIFEPFQRNAVGATTPGTGLGLSLVARFAELHDGRAWVEERPGGGAAFKVVLAT